MTEHTNKQFDADLQRIRTELLQMGGLVESMIQDAMDALSAGDMILVERVKEREKDVNRLEVDIDERVTQILARHQPAAIDLRTLLAVTKMLTDMERSGDEAEKLPRWRDVCMRMIVASSPSLSYAIWLTRS